MPADLQDVVLRCLEKDPAKRYQDVESLDRALAGCGCAGLWTEERAVAWWQAHGDSKGGVPANGPTRELALTQEAT